MRSMLKTSLHEVLGTGMYKNSSAHIQILPGFAMILDSTTTSTDTLKILYLP